MIIGRVVVFELVLPSPLPLNSNQRMHPMEKARHVRLLRDEAERVARREPTMIPTPTHCTLHLGHSTRGKRDSLNFYPTVKAIIDGLVRAEWLDEDDDDHLLGPDFRPYYAGLKNQVVLRFEFVPIEVPAEQMVMYG